jgi:hypothetical protein
MRINPQIVKMIAVFMKDCLSVLYSIKAIIDVVVQIRKSRKES